MSAGEFSLRQDISEAIAENTGGNAKRSTGKALIFSPTAELEIRTCS